MQPRRFASYTLLEPIGHGGMATVYRARQDSLDRTVAVKVLSEHLTTSDEFLQRFIREARTVANLRHPNVITVHDFGQDERGVPYLVLEYVDGPTLADLMDAGLEDARIPDLLDQVASGLDYAHGRGVVHRDVKPGNILLAEDGRVILADFGLASLLEATSHLTMSGGVIGTPEYMSPEQASGLGVDARTDVYALGVVLFEMLTGERPFTSPTPMAVLLKHLQQPPPSLTTLRPDLPPAVDVVVQQALAKDPAQRFQTPRALARAFREALTTPSAESARPPRPPRSAEEVPPRENASGVSVLSRSAGARGAFVHSTVAAGADSDARQRTVAAGANDHAGRRTVAEGAHAPTRSRPASGRSRAPRPRSLASHAAAAAPARPCPGCGASIPSGAGICPACTYMLPLDQLPRPPAPRKLERREVVFNLLPFNLRWSPPGLEAARRLAADALRQETRDGWEPASIGEPVRLVEGRGLGGPIVRSAILTLERLA